MRQVFIALYSMKRRGPPPDESAEVLARLHGTRPALTPPRYGTVLRESDDSNRRLRSVWGLRLLRHDDRAVSRKHTIPHP
jgi:hypothetical protein